MNIVQLTESSPGTLIIKSVGNLTRNWKVNKKMFAFPLKKFLCILVASPNTVSSSWLLVWRGQVSSCWIWPYQSLPRTYDRWLATDFLPFLFSVYSFLLRKRLECWQVLGQMNIYVALLTVKVTADNWRNVTTDASRPRIFACPESSLSAGWRFAVLGP